MPAYNDLDQMVDGLRLTIVSLVASDRPDLSARQMGVFLTCYLKEGPHTVRGLASDLNISKPAITRALDRLETFQLARREVDTRDRRSVMVKQTKKGSDFLRELGVLAANAFSRPRGTPAESEQGPRARKSSGIS